MPQANDIWTVSRLNRTARQLLENQLSTLWLEGELTNFKSYRSGHWYFSLQDKQSQVRGVMFSFRNRAVTFKPQDGQQIRVQAEVSLYEQRGQFQLKVLRMQPAGTGALLQQLEQLKRKLHAEGLFAEDNKQPLPYLPRQIGVITSANGAAFHDILHVLKRRCPQIPVVLYPASVQGAAAPDQLNQALQTAIQRNDCDLLIIGRGGGSLEDLFCFNDETLTRSVAACPIPIISAVGHEVDFSLTDFAADKRAPTPSAAAEIACPDMAAWAQLVTTWQQRLKRNIAQQLRVQRQQLEQLQRRLLSPNQLLQQRAQQLDTLQERMERVWRHASSEQHNRLRYLQKRLSNLQPQNRLQQHRQQLAQYQQRLNRCINEQLQRQQQAYRPLFHRLQMASPKTLLQRGYSLTLLESTGEVINAQTPVNEGDQLTTHLAGDRRLQSQVTKVLEDDHK